MTRTGKLTTCSPCSSWRHTGIIAVSGRPCRGSNSLIPRTVDNKPIREVRCPLCTIANCPTRRGQYCYASIGPTPQRRRRRKPAYNRSSGRLWGLCSRCRDDHDLCPWIATPSSSMPAQDFDRCDGYHRMVDCIRAPKPRGFPPQSYCAGRAQPPCPHKNATLEAVITEPSWAAMPFRHAGIRRYVWSSSQYAKVIRDKLTQPVDQGTGDRAMASAERTICVLCGKGHITRQKRDVAFRQWSD